MKKVRTAHNYKSKGGFVFTKPSLTVPGQAASISEIQERFRRGQGVMTYPAVYNPAFPPEYDRLDRVGKIEFARENAARVQALQEQLRKQEAERKRKEAEAIEAAKAAEEIKAAQNDDKSK